MTSRLPLQLFGVDYKPNGEKFREGNTFAGMSPDGRYAAIDACSKWVPWGNSYVCEKTGSYIRDLDKQRSTFLFSTGKYDDQDTSISEDGRYLFEEVNLHNHGTGIFRYPIEGGHKLGKPVRVDVNSNGEPSERNSISFIATFSRDGRYVAFESDATNLVPDDTNGAEDVFLHDMDTGKTARVDVTSDGQQGFGGYQPIGNPIAAISSNGRYVAFLSDMPNLFDKKRYSGWHVGLHDLDTGKTIPVDINSSGKLGSGDYDPSFMTQLGVSDDGKVAFDSRIDLTPGELGAKDVYVRDTVNGVTTLVSKSSSDSDSGAWSSFPALTPDGRYVSFQSQSGSIVPADTNGRADTFVHDLKTGRTRLVSVRDDGTQAVNGDSWYDTHISRDGSRVMFPSAASNLIDGYGFTDGWTMRDYLSIHTDLAPTCDDQKSSTDQDQSVTIALSCTDPNVEDRATLKESIAGQPKHSARPLTIDANGNVQYVPQSDFVGDDSFTYSANDGELDSNLATVEIEVVKVPPRNNLPTCNNLSGETIEGNKLDFQADCNDQDPGDSLTYAVVAQPAHAAVPVVADSKGQMSYIPEQGFTASDQFAYKASDGHGDSTVATVKVQVDKAPARNRVPVCDGLTVQTHSGQPVVVRPQCNDPDGQALTYKIELQPSHAQAPVISGGDGLIAYTPAPGFAGADSFMYSANDGIDTSPPAQVQVLVSGIGTEPGSTSGSPPTGVSSPLGPNPAALSLQPMDLRILSHRLVVNRRSASLAVLCRGALADHCQGRLRLTGRYRHHRIDLASTKVWVKSGAVARIKLRPKASAIRLFQRHHIKRVGVLLSVVQSNGAQRAVLPLRFK